MRPHENPDPNKWPWPDAAKYVSRFSFFDPPSVFARALVETMPIESGVTRLLDIGCGSGIVGLYSLIERKAKSVTFSDIQCEAIAESCSNTVRLIERGEIGVGRVEFLDPAPFDQINPELVAAHTLVEFNPPQIPQSRLSAQTLREIEAEKTKTYFRLGGPDGLKVAREFLAWYARLPTPKPEAVTLLSSFIGKARIEQAIRDAGLRMTILAAKRVSLRSMFWNAADKLSAEERQDAALEKNERGWTKEVLTIVLKQA